MACQLQLLQQVLTVLYPMGLLCWMGQVIFSSQSNDSHHPALSPKWDSQVAGFSFQPEHRFRIASQKSHVASLCLNLSTKWGKWHGELTVLEILAEKHLQCCGVRCWVSLLALLNRIKRRENLAFWNAKCSTALSLRKGRYLLLPFSICLNKPHLPHFIGKCQIPAGWQSICTGCKSLVPTAVRGNVTFATARAGFGPYACRKDLKEALLTYLVWM